MARLHEYQGKAILTANGFKTPRGRAASTADDVPGHAARMLAMKAGQFPVETVIDPESVRGRQTAEGAH